MASEHKWAEKKAEVEAIIPLLEEGMLVKKALARHNISYSTYTGVRHRYPDLEERLTDITASAQYERNQHQWDGIYGHNARVGKGSKDIFDQSIPLPEKPPFTEWRMSYLGRPVAKHQTAVVEAYEDQTNLIVFVLGPPGSGKDTTAGDIVLYEKCDDQKGMRAAWIMESEQFSKRRLGERLSPYLTDPKTYEITPDGPGCAKPTRSLIDDFGPFKWKAGMIYPDGTPVERTTWTKHEMYLLRNQAAEADPDLWATGIGGALYGSRVDLMVVSDPFTVENQRSPTQREAQLEWFRGTVKSRLDEGGRLIILGTRVMNADNYERLLDEFIGQAKPIYENGYYTKYSNGVATVIYPAIQTDDDGNEESYWEGKFPLDGYLVEADGTRYNVLDLTDEEYLRIAQGAGVTRLRGLREIRAENEAMFDTLYQQAPPEGEAGEFSDLILDHCDDPSRTLGVYRSKEVLVLGVDPARSGGAGWVVWGVDRDANTITVVDFFFATRLGISGIRNKLISAPINQYLPTWLVYETNHEEAVLDHPDVKSLIASSAVNVHKHFTHHNRYMGDASVASMSLWMRDGRIRFPASTPEDRRKMVTLKQHFKNWDARTAAERAIARKFKHLPDDLAMAAWIGYVKAREILERDKSTLRRMRRRVPISVARRWVHTRPIKEETAATYRDDAPAENDLVGWFHYGGSP